MDNDDEEDSLSINLPINDTHGDSARNILLLLWFFVSGEDGG